jgi:hypothetical protein
LAQTDVHDAPGLIDEPAAAAQQCALRGPSFYFNNRSTCSRG